MATDLTVRRTMVKVTTVGQPSRASAVRRRTAHSAGRGHRVRAIRPGLAFHSHVLVGGGTRCLVTLARLSSSNRGAAPWACRLLPAATRVSDYLYALNVVSLVLGPHITGHLVAAFGQTICRAKTVPDWRNGAF